eukprot:INCI11828.1.p1 GENE.INCI11828.1~~INCI11828.1.p1  ORF type:complete len:469 (-),score=62.55 INCI11828.1:1436-2842(-)
MAGGVSRRVAAVLGVLCVGLVSPLLGYNPKRFPGLQDPDLCPAAQSYQQVLGDRVRALQEQAVHAAADHCHWQACEIGSARRRTLSRELCGSERSDSERTACLEQRRGHPYGIAGNFSAEAPAWPLLQIPGSFKNLLYVKNMKTGGSTLNTVLDKWVAHSGALSSISNREGDYVVKEIPMHHYVVRSSGNNLTSDAFWLSSCRHPVQRSISHYFHCLRSARVFTSTGQPPPPTSCGAHALLGPEYFFEHSSVVHDYQWSFMHNNLLSPKQAVDQFDFVFVNERFDESLVLLHMQLRFRIVDMLYIQSKNFSNPPLELGEAELERLLELNQRDLAISEYATARLDATIDLLQPIFSEMLHRFRQLKRHAVDACQQFSSKRPGSGDESLSQRVHKQRQRCIEAVCSKNVYCRAGSLAPDLSRIGQTGDRPTISIPECVPEWYGDGSCDKENDRAECLFDGGDCTVQHQDL